MDNIQIDRDNEDGWHKYDQAHSKHCSGVRMQPVENMSYEEDHKYHYFARLKNENIRMHYWLNIDHTAIHCDMYEI